MFEYLFLVAAFYRNAIFNYIITWKKAAFSPNIKINYCPPPSPITEKGETVQNVGSLSVFTGPMFCGKTTRLIQEITRCADILNGSSFENKRPLLINSRFDNRDPHNLISSHSSSYKGVSDKIDIVQAQKLSDVDISNYTIIGIDEAQFYDDLFIAVSAWINQGKTIYCAGLDSDRNMNKFGQIVDLCYIADSFIKLPSICALCMETKKEFFRPSDLTPAPFTACINEQSTDQIQVGGTNIYRPVCRFHFNKLTKV